MKTTLISLLSAALLGLASFASNHAFDAAGLTAACFATGLAAWTVVQYSRQPRLLTLDRPMHLPLKMQSATAPRALSLAA